MNDYYESRKIPATAIVSLVLGILSVTCFGLLAGIPAIICGHIAHRKISRGSRKYKGAGLAITGFILGYLSFLVTLVLLALAIPAATQAAIRLQATQELNNTKQIDLAIQQMALDGKSSGDKTLGYPADAGITSATELKNRLIKGGYLTAENAEHLHFDRFQIGNVSESDPADTILIRLLPQTPKAIPVIFRKDGNGAILIRNQTVTGEDPPRDPAYLAP